jgi:hypothetical protein
VEPSGNGVEREYNLCTSLTVCPTCTADCFEPIDDPKRDSVFRLQTNSPLENAGFPCPWGTTCDDISSYDSYLGTTPFPRVLVLNTLCQGYPAVAAALGTGVDSPDCSY